MTLSQEELKRRHALMLQWQKENHPWVPTLRELAPLWGFESPSVALWTVVKLYEAGMVISKNKSTKGKCNQYFAVQLAGDMLSQ